MHGVSESLDLSSLIGLEVTLICLGSHQIQIILLPEGLISIECPFELIAPSGDMIDNGEPQSLAVGNHLGALLESKIDSATPIPPSTVEVHFDCGHLLRLFDDSEQYESFQIYPGPIVV